MGVMIETSGSGFELYLSTRLMVLVRFGLWDEILATPFKSETQARMHGHSLAWTLL